MTAADGRRAATPSDPLRDAFTELHSARLHGFSLILALGDRARAGNLAAEAIAAGADRHDELRHPERAAAWLRARVVRAYRPRRAAAPSAERRATLRALGLSEAAIDALVTLSPVERAAMIVEQIENLELLDVATVVDRRAGQLGRLLTRARTRYAGAFIGSRHAAEAAGATPEAVGSGPLASRIRAIAARTMP